jgi:hypothetical protein
MSTREFRHYRSERKTTYIISEGHTVIPASGTSHLY